MSATSSWMCWYSRSAFSMSLMFNSIIFTAINSPAFVKPHQTFTLHHHHRPVTQTKLAQRTSDQPMQLTQLWNLQSKIAGAHQSCGRRFRGLKTALNMTCFQNKSYSYYACVTVLSWFLWITLQPWNALKCFWRPGSAGNAGEAYFLLHCQAYFTA